MNVLPDHKSLLGIPQCIHYYSHYNNLMDLKGRYKDVWP